MTPSTAISRLPALVPRPKLRMLWPVPVAVGSGVVFGGLVAAGQWPVAVTLLVMVPAVTLLHREPLAGVAAWLVLAPLVVNTDQMSIRMVFWIVHRLLPVALLLALVLRPLVIENTRPLKRLRWVDALAAGYVVAGLISVAYTSPSAGDATIHLYDNVAMPVCLYAAVRLLGPDRDEIRRWLFPAIAIALAIQVAVGLVSWGMPSLLPSAWESIEPRARTTGTVRSVSVYGVTVITGALVLLDEAAAATRSLRRVLAYLGFTVAVGMVFLTFSRGSWLAGLLAIGAALLVHRRIVGRLALIVGMVAILVVSSGLLTSQFQFASERLDSEQADESALARLPVALASMRMLQERPLTGFGYENFDRFDRPYQGPVMGYYPEKDHASHNLYLTLAAEQGVIGLVLFVAPVVYWWSRTRAARRRGPLDPGNSRLTLLLWLALLAHVAVNNFSNMRVSFGLGLWWLTLGLVASLVASHEDEAVRS